MGVQEGVERAVEFDNDFGGQTIFIKRAPAAAPVVPEALAHYLVMIGGTEPGRLVEIGASPITIGRSPQQTLAFADAELSRQHARVSLVDGTVIAEDLGSTNGTFVDADRIDQPRALHEGQVLRVGGQFFMYERRSRRDVERTQELGRDLARASAYVQSLLPPPLETGPVRTEWRFVPSAQLGGDGFGYEWLDPDTFVFYLVDVSGHGVGSALHSVTVLNVLRQRALASIDFRNPAEVFAALNDRFPMDRHNGMYFTMWYGVYHAGDRSLAYGCAGHHPAYLVPLDRSATQPLGTPNFMIGVMPGCAYETQRITLPAGSTLYVFSDGVFEFETKDQQRWALPDLLPHLNAPVLPGTPETERIYRIVREAAGSGPLDDDYSLMVVSFV
jgi:serine phosphatase RsbU (regulator of sigma subunit)